ncbi:ankyrin repeat domain-containing protein [Rhodohalobacter sp.]|uniref:ankyrin repeat domain-containing protein n=1 Tax=Rhodohalobacter sp. TaxID=1974210 RepID=UPI002ACED832|nr:ankyrin repeat domain-containing protein [Rhodohalobacter sp.]MDZ7755652.1 ankyrin repeat domain-containing protein [Rhodohalobacter sp.]
MPTLQMLLKDNILEAIQNIDIVSLNVLLAEGADINTVDEKGNTALMLASKIGNPRMVKIILAHSPNLNQQNNMGYTALMVASEQGQVHIIEQLLKQGADTSLKNMDGRTAAELAIRNGQPNAADLLNGKSQNVITR